MDFKTKNKKGQAEMVGLVFIVLIIIIMGTIFVYIMLGDDDNDFKRSEFQASKMTDKFVNTIIELQVEECGKKSVKQLLREYVEGQKFCAKDISGNGLETMIFLNETVFSNILLSTFEEQGINYNFKIVSDGVSYTNLFYPEESACEFNTSKIIRQSEILIPLSDFENDVRFSICIGTN